LLQYLIVVVSFIVFNGDVVMIRLLRWIIYMCRK
jgi:hypothetical protein